MSLRDWFCDALEETGRTIVEKVENKARNITRRGDAIFGCEEYENSSTIERIAGGSGLHSKSVNDERAEKIVKEAKKIISTSKAKLTKQKNTLKKEITKTNDALLICRNLKLDTLREINNEIKPNVQKFNNLKAKLEKVIQFDKQNNKGSNEKKTTTLNRHISNSFSDSIMRPINQFDDSYKVENANKYLDEANNFKMEVDVYTASLDTEITKIKKIYWVTQDEQTFLKSILGNLQKTSPQLKTSLSKKVHSAGDAKKALFVGEATETIMLLLEKNVLTNTNQVNETYVKNTKKLKVIADNLNKGL